MAISQRWSCLALMLLVPCALAIADGPLPCGYSSNGFVIDLSPLSVLPGGIAVDYTTEPDDQAYTFEMNVCGVSTSRDFGCYASNGTICQFQWGTYIQTVARWPVSGTHSGFSLINGDITQGVELAFANGDECASTKQPRTSRVQFVCSNVAAGEITVQDSGCDYNFTFPTLYACANKTSSCGLTSEGKTIDLTPLFVASGPDYKIADALGYEYDFNICGASTLKYTDCVKRNASICQYLSQDVVTAIASWPPSGQPSGFSLIGSTIYEGIQLQFANGENCFPTGPPGQPRTSRIQFVCHSKEVGPVSVLASADDCDYTIVFPTSYACVD